MWDLVRLHWAFVSSCWELVLWVSVSTRPDCCGHWWGSITGSLSFWELPVCGYWLLANKFVLLPIWLFNCDKLHPDSAWTDAITIIVFIPLPSKQTSDHSQESIHTLSKMSRITHKRPWDMLSLLDLLKPISFPPILPLFQSLASLKSHALNTASLFEQLILQKQLPNPL